MQYSAHLKIFNPKTNWSNISGASTACYASWTGLRH